MRRALQIVVALVLGGTPRAEPASPQEGAGRTEAAQPSGDAGPPLQRSAAAQRRAESERALGAQAPAPPPSECRLMQPGSDATTSKDCVGCHGVSGRDQHAVDVDYEASRARGNAGLRPLAEVVKRGLLVPGGVLRCVTCHEGRSPWAHRIALPPGSTATAGVDPRDPATYEGAGVPSPPAPGSRVAVKPLCMACHTFGE